MVACELVKGPVSENREVIALARTANLAFILAYSNRLSEGGLKVE